MNTFWLNFSGHGQGSVDGGTGTGSGTETGTGTGTGTGGGDCKDTGIYCSYHVPRGDCKTMAVVRTKCQKSCGVC